MRDTFLTLTPRDPIISRDGRPFGIGQGNRMHGLVWPLPSVVAGSFRTALVKASKDGDFTGTTPEDLLQLKVAGVFPSLGSELYLPAPNDCAWDKQTKKVFRVQPIALNAGEGVDFTTNSLDPVRLTREQAQKDFKAKAVPVWWPLKKYVQWLLEAETEYAPEWFDFAFLAAAKLETRDHVAIDECSGASKESHLFTTAGLYVTHLPRFYDTEVSPGQKRETFTERFAEIALTARVTGTDAFGEQLKQLNTWHPLGGERRLVHWRQSDTADLWKCPDKVKQALTSATQVRMILTTPAIFKRGWRPGWLNAQLEGVLPGTDIQLKLVGVSNARWKAVSGWSLAHPRGPKAIRRMVPAGSVYFFKTMAGDISKLADHWLQAVSDGEQERRDGFGLAVWGIW